MTSRSMAVVCLVGIVLILVMPLGGQVSMNKAGVGMKPLEPEENSSIYLPLVARNYPLVTIFGIDAIRTFVLVKDAGSSWVRLNTFVDWSNVEAVEGTYDWSRMSDLEQRIIAAAQEGLQVIMRIQMSPSWARKYPNSACGPIRSDKFDAFAAFTAEVVKRYSVPPYNVRYYHVWNEPDGPVEYDSKVYGCWGEFSYPNDPYFGGEYYGEMLKRVYPAIKAVDPNVQVLTGALLLDCDPRGWGYGYCATRDKAKQWNFFEGILKSGAANAFDILTFNGYAYYQSGKNTVWSERYARSEWVAHGGQVDGKLDYLREKMQQYGVNKPLMLTESAIIYTNGDEEAKSDYLVWTYANTQSQGLMATIWYTLYGWRRSELLTSEGNPLPAYNALKTMTGILAQADYKRREDNLGYTKFVYHLGNQEIWLLIPTGEFAGASYSVEKPNSFIKLVDIYGNEMPDPGSMITFNRPTYVFRNR